MRIQAEKGSYWREPNGTSSLLIPMDLKMWCKIPKTVAAKVIFSEMFPKQKRSETRKPRWFPKRRDIYYGVTSDHFCLTTNKAYLLRSKSVYRATGFDLKLGTSHCTRIESSGAYGDIIRSFAAILPLLLPPMWEMSDCEA